MASKRTFSQASGNNGIFCRPAKGHGYLSFHPFNAEPFFMYHDTLTGYVEIMSISEARTLAVSIRGRRWGSGVKDGASFLADELANDTTLVEFVKSHSRFVDGWRVQAAKAKTRREYFDLAKALQHTSFKRVQARTAYTGGRRGFSIFVLSYRGISEDGTKMFFRQAHATMTVSGTLRNKFGLVAMHMPVGSRPVRFKPVDCTMDVLDENIRCAVAIFFLEEYYGRALDARTRTIIDDYCHSGSGRVHWFGVKSAPDAFDADDNYCASLPRSVGVGF